MRKVIFFLSVAIFSCVEARTQKKEILKILFNNSICYNLNSKTQVEIYNNTSRTIKCYLGLQYFDEGNWSEIDGDIFSNEKTPVYNVIKAHRAINLYLTAENFDLYLIDKNKDKKYRFVVAFPNPFKPIKFIYKRKRGLTYEFESVFSQEFTFCN